MNVTSGILSTVVMVLAFVLTSGSGAKYFTAVLGLAISTTTISYLMIFPALAKLRFSHPDVPRPYRIPGGRWVSVAVSSLCTIWALLATVCLLWPGFGTSDPASALPDGFAGQRLQYELSQFIPLAVLLALGVGFYLVGGRTGRHMIRARIPLPAEAATPAIA
jgi:amino acid transporter